MIKKNILVLSNKENIKIYIFLKKKAVIMTQIYITCINIYFKYNHTVSPVSYYNHSNNSHIHNSCYSVTKNISIPSC